MLTECIPDKGLMHTLHEELPKPNGETKSNPIRKQAGDVA